MTTEDVMKALGRYAREVNENDRRTAAILEIKRSTLAGWLRGADPPQKRSLARVAGFLRRVGYLQRDVKSRDATPLCTSPPHVNPESSNDERLTSGSMVLRCRPSAERSSELLMTS